MIVNNKKNNQNLDKHINSEFQQRLQQLLTDLQLDDAPAGGSLVVYQAGRCIVQANVGMAQANIPWQPETLSLNFSTGKGVLATLIHVLVSQQLLDYNKPIASYWPEFSSNGKANITLRTLMSHQANLFSITSIDADSEVLLDWDTMLDKIAAMPTTLPEDSSLYSSAYSALVYGWVLGGVIESVTDMSLAGALRYYLTEPLDIADSCYFGVPGDKVDRVARLVKNFDISQQGHTEEQPQLRSRRNKPVLKADSENTLRIYASLPNYRCWEQHAATPHAVVESNNDKNIDELPILDTAQINRLYLNTSQLNLKNYKSALIPANKQPIDYYNRQTLQAVIPAANGVASANALATIYAMLANGGTWQGQTLIDAATFEQLSTPQVMGMDAVMPAHMNWRLGYHRLFSVCADTESGFGHMGYNGSVAWCDPTRQLSFAFVHNFDVTMLNDIRQFALTEAILNLVDKNIA
ncbi:serine hydrolase domain-containing protein [Psychrobacter sp. P11G5]|uniref:serine hydrolase domain-containing protein n=1 Tax=Psychrobacter sp. P11G5 TaxID=1699624 RepID=UPI00078BA61A|nr:serine hydrolase domain-containing protein [Psychrobacter sp. P11G5]AMN67664.1 beta-lactamase [Psychrobacter sp. P11G5]